MKRFSRLIYQLQYRSIILYIFIILAVFIWVVHNVYTNADYFISPDENTTNVFIDEYSRTGKLYMDYSYNQSTKGTVLPRGTYLDTSNKVIPVLPVGFNVISGTIDLVLKDASYLIIPVCFIFIVLLAYLLLRYFNFSRHSAMVGSTVILILPPFIHFASRSRVTDIIILLFFSLAVYLSLRSLDGNRKMAFLSGLFFFSGVFVNQKILFLVFAYVLAYVIGLGFIYMNDMKKFRARLISTPFYLLGALLPFIALIMTNNTLYGGYFKNGYIAIAQAVKSSGAADRPLLNINPTQMWFNINHYFLGITLPLVALCIFLGIILLSKKHYRANANRQLYIIFFILMILITLLYFSNIAAWGGSGEPTLTASFNRYLLPIVLMGLPFMWYFLQSTKKSFRVILIIFIVVTSVWGNIYYTGAQQSIVAYVNSMKNLRKFIIESTSSDAIILTNSYDKIIYPYRTTINQQAFPIEALGDLDLPDTGVLTSTILNIADTYPYRPIYYLQENPILTERLTKGLNTQNLTLEREGIYRNRVLYKVDRYQL